MRKKLSVIIITLFISSLTLPAFSQASCQYCAQSWSISNQEERDKYNIANTWIAFEHIQQLDDVFPSMESMIDGGGEGISDALENIRDVFEDMLPDMYEDFDQATNDYNDAMDQNDQDYFNCIQGCTTP